MIEGESYSEREDLSKERSFVVSREFLQDGIENTRQFLNQGSRHFAENLLEIFVDSRVILMEITTVQCTQFQRLNQIECVDVRSPSIDRFT